LCGSGSIDGVEEVRKAIVDDNGEDADDGTAAMLSWGTVGILLGQMLNSSLRRLMAAMVMGMLVWRSSHVRSAEKVMFVLLMLVSADREGRCGEDWRLTGDVGWMRLRFGLL
jgi:hypothetical protein